MPKKNYGTITVYVKDDRLLELTDEVLEALREKQGKKVSRSQLFDECLQAYFVKQGLMINDGKFLKKEKRAKKLAKIEPPLEGRSKKKVDGKKKKNRSSGSSIRSGGARRRPGVKTV